MCDDLGHARCDNQFFGRRSWQCYALRRSEGRLAERGAGDPQWFRRRKVAGGSASVEARTLLRLIEPLSPKYAQCPEIPGIRTLFNYAP